MLSSIWAPLLIVLLGLYYAPLQWLHLANALRSRRWDRREGEIVSAGGEFALFQPARPHVYHLGGYVRIAYKYSVPDRFATTTYERKGNRLRFGPTSIREAVRLGVDHPAGSSVTVYVNPRNMDDAVLRPGVSPLGFAAFIASTAILIAGLAWLGAVVATRAT
jgi:hypothetical protein